MAMHLVWGLLGVLLACVAADINAQTTSVGLSDIQGELGIGTRLGSWIGSLFDIGQAMGMLVAPWLAVTFSMRRFAAFAVVLLGATGVACAAAHDISAFLVLRYLQGLSTGFLIPLLMSAALRFLTPSIKLFGLAAYALTATFAPNFGAPIVAWAHQSLGYSALYLATLPIVAIAFALIVYGIPQDPVRLSRFRQFDWRGLLLGWTVCACLIIVVTQGERLDWMASPLLASLLIVALALLPLFVLNEWYHPLPFIWPQILLRPNFGYGTILLFGFIVLSLAVSALPSQYLAEVHGYRPLQSVPLALLLALPSLVLLPLVSYVLGFKSVDARWLVVVGLALMAAVCWMYSDISPDWIRHNFYFGQSLAAIAQALVVVSLLKLSTGVVAPQEGPYAASTINTTRALAAPVGTGLLDLFLRRRADLHSSRLLDHVGAQRYELLQSAPLTGHDAAPFGAPPAGLSSFAAHMSEQAQILALADAWRVFAVLAVGLALACVIAERVYPPHLNIPPGT